AFITAAEGFTDTFLRWVRGVSGIAAAMMLALSPPFVLLVVLAGGTALITGGSMAAADLLPFLLLGLGLTAPVLVRGEGADDLQAGGGAPGRVGVVLAAVPVPDEARRGVPHGHRVEVGGVRFGYEPGREVLRGIDLVLVPGTVTAL